MYTLCRGSLDKSLDRLKGVLAIRTLLDLVIRTQVAVLADALCIKNSLLVLAEVSLLGSAFGVVAVLAHAVGVVVLRGVAASRNILSVLLNRF